MSVAPLICTPAQILHSSGLVSLQHHSRSAFSSQRELLDTTRQ